MTAKTSPPETPDLDPGAQASSDPARPTSPAAPRLRGESCVVAGRSPWECLRDFGEEAWMVPAFLWEAPSGEAIAGIGAAAGIVASGRGRFVEARDRIAALLRGAEAGAAAGAADGAARNGLPGGFPGAVAIGGFAFSEASPRGDGWPGFPDAWFTVPERVWWKGPDGLAVETTWRLEGVDDPGIADELPSRADVPARTREDAPAWTREGWSRAVRRSLERIASGQISKVVLARCVEVSLDQGQSPLQILESLREDHPGCYRFLIADGRGNAFLGASPERLVRLAGGSVFTEAVAGTARRAACAGVTSEAPDDDRARALALLASAKDRSEHEIVLHHVREALRADCSELESPAEPEVLTLRHMLHLRTPVRGRAREGAHVLDLVARLHPTPAVAGWPRDAALSAIHALEPTERGWYAGPIGWVNASGGGDFAVAIRSVSVRGRRARLFAGAGIVLGSNTDLEWSETELKMRPILDAITRP